MRLHLRAKKRVSKECETKTQTTDFNVAHDKPKREKKPPSSRICAFNILVDSKLDTFKKCLCCAVHHAHIKYRYMNSISWWYDLSMMHFLPFFMRFIRILRRRRRHRYCCVCKEKIRLMACVCTLHCVLFIDRLVLWSQCMHFCCCCSIHIFPLCFQEEREKKQQITYPCVVVCCAVCLCTVHSVDQTLVKLYRWMCICFVDAVAVADAIVGVVFTRCCPFFTQRTHSLLFRQFLAVLCTNGTKHTRFI